jgi:hypothetical protein
MRRNPTWATALFHCSQFGIRSRISACGRVKGNRYVSSNFDGVCFRWSIGIQRASRRCRDSSRAAPRSNREKVAAAQSKPCVGFRLPSLGRARLCLGRRPLGVPAASALPDGYRTATFAAMAAGSLSKGTGDKILRNRSGGANSDGWRLSERCKTCASSGKSCVSSGGQTPERFIKSISPMDL